MTHHRLPYDDPDTTREMTVDCHEVEHTLGIEHRGLHSQPSELLGGASAPATSRVHSHYDVPDDLARLADGLELHFD